MDLWHVSMSHYGTVMPTAKYSACNTILRDLVAVLYYILPYSGEVGHIRNIGIPNSTAQYLVAVLYLEVLYFELLYRRLVRPIVTSTSSVTTVLHLVVVLCICILYCGTVSLPKSLLLASTTVCNLLADLCTMILYSCTL